jgi:sugar phosphate isomerase/epimerase
MSGEPDRLLGLAHLTVLDVPPPELVTLAARIGYAFVGLRLHPLRPGATYYEIPRGTPAMREMRRRLDSEGIGVHDVEFVTLDAGFIPARLSAMLESARALGAARLTVCADDDDFGRLVANFAELCDLAASFNLGVDLEFMAWRRLNTLAAAIRVVTAAAKPNGCVLVDALHLARTGGSPSDLGGIPPRLIRSAQLCDAPAATPTSTEAILAEARAGRLAPGEGELPLCALLAVLPADLRLSLEVPTASGQPAEAHARHVFEATQRLIAACESIRSSPAAPEN